MDNISNEEAIISISDVKICHAMIIINVVCELINMKEEKNNNKEEYLKNYYNSSKT